MFSPANAAEIVGPSQPNTIAAVRDFLDSVGPYWFPVEGADLVGILEREATRTRWNSRTSVDVVHSTVLH